MMSTKQRFHSILLAAAILTFGVSANARSPSIQYPCFSYLDQVRVGPGPSYTIEPEATQQPTVVVIEPDPYAWLWSWLAGLSVAWLAYMADRYRISRNELELQLTKTLQWQEQFESQQQQVKELFDSRISGIEQELEEKRSRDSQRQGKIKRLEAQMRLAKMLKKPKQGQPIQPQPPNSSDEKPDE